MKEYMMALDQGTTSSRCILFDKMGNIRAKAQKEFAQIYPQEGWVEHNPKDIWSSQYSVMTEALTMLGEDECIAGIGITNQRETTIVWNKQTGEPVYNAIVCKSHNCFICPFNSVKVYKSCVNFRNFCFTCSRECYTCTACTIRFISRTA